MLFSCGSQLKAVVLRRAEKTALADQVLAFVRGYEQPALNTVEFLSLKVVIDREVDFDLCLFAVDLLGLQRDHDDFAAYVDFIAYIAFE